MKTTCENCRFWKPSKTFSLKDHPSGICKRTKMFWNCTEWIDSTEDKEGNDVVIRGLSPEHINNKAFVRDGSDFFAELITLADFGCVQFEASNKQAETKLCTMRGVSGGAFLAFMRIDYEGIYENSLKLFKSKTAADKYISELKKENAGDAVTYDIVELHFH